MANRRKRNPLNSKEYDEKDSSWDSFLEIITSGLKISVFAACIYILKEIFVLANTMYSCVESQTMDIIKLELIPAGILILLAIVAFIIMGKD